MDVALTTLSARSNVTFTRYADDLFFSTNLKGVLRPIELEIEQAIFRLEVPSNLKLNAGKTRHSSKRGARRVTGIVLGSDGRPYIGRALKREIRALLHRFDSLTEEKRGTLRGMIAYATGLDPQFMNALIAKYGLPAVRRARFTAPPSK
jgi:RNA-directed DNA polymerase